jgi:hypothetical protein
MAMGEPLSKASDGDWVDMLREWADFTQDKLK